MIVRFLVILYDSHCDNNAIATRTILTTATECCSRQGQEAATSCRVARDSAIADSENHKKFVYLHMSNIREMLRKFNMFQ